jgi:WXXGXW repeat (2 copies)
MSRAIGLFLLVAVMVAVPATSFGAVAVSITIAPPVLPVYSQPICPGAGYIWTPGYWAYGPYGYYWVPGTWVMAPFIGALWTPGYWGWGAGVYLWHAGYWGPHVGFYGGINYGFGYLGVGYAGGYWNHGSFFYNSAVNNVNRTVVRNVYSKTVVNNASGNRVSYNGGRGGTTARPTSAEAAAARDRHAGPTSAQTQLRRSASASRAQRASVNNGRPATLATARPEAFTAHQAATGNRGNANRQSINHRAVSRTVSQGASRQSHSSARNTAAARTTPAHNHAVAQHSAAQHSVARHSVARHSVAQHPAAQHSATHSTPAPHHSTPPASHSSAHNTEAPAARHTAAQPHYSAPAQHSAQPPASSTPRREGGHGG